MAKIRHINEEEYAAKALELLNDRWEGYVNYAFGLLQQNMSPGMACERLEKKVCVEMVRCNSQKGEVPSELLDIRNVLTNYEDIICNIMADAEKRWIDAEIEKVYQGEVTIG